MVSKCCFSKTCFRYLVTKTKWTWRLKTQCRPVLISLVLVIDQVYNMSMMIRKAFKYRLKTKPEDELLLRQFAGSCRFVWNKALALQKERLDQGERCLSYNKLAVLLPGWKMDFPFLKEVHS